MFRQKTSKLYVSQRRCEVSIFFPEYAEYDCVRSRVDLGRALGMIEIQPLFKQALEACVEMSN